MQHLATRDRDIESLFRRRRYPLAEVTMNRYLPAALIALCAALGVVLAVQRSILTGAQRDLELVQSRVEKLEARQKELVARKSVEELQDQVARVERKAAAASVAAEAAGAAASKPAPKDANPPVQFTEDDITKIVEARLEERLKKNGGKKPGE